MQLGNPSELASDPRIKNAIDLIGKAIGEQDAAKADLAGAALFLVERVVTDVNRIANALEGIRISQMQLAANAPKKADDNGRDFFGMPNGN